ncbi:MAG TPA: AI-2E family transporter [Candidatus Cryptobacteroides pullicola]|nr:AI-2E family transporter [Candidatus Cryptobacteroides pullicola]
MANNSRERIFKITLVALIVGLGIILFRQARPFFGGILSALTLYILLRRPTFRLAERLRRPTLATVIMVLAVIVFIAVPLTLIIWFIVSQIQQAEWNVGEIIAPAQQMFDIIEKRFGIDIVSQQTISFVAGKLTALGQSVLGGIGNFFVNLLVAVLLLFFLLNGGRKMEQYLASIIPMKNINKRETMEKVNKMVKSNAIGIPMVATLQGIIAFIGYMIFDVPNAGLAAIATGFCSIVPIVGTMVVWVPLGIYFMVLGQWGQAIGLLVFSAIFISQSDNLLRFILQKKMADTHPLITIFGVFLGLSLFGFIGIIFGPLLVSLFLLFVDMFRKEYLSDDEADGEGGSQSAADSPASAEPAAAAQEGAPGKPADSAQAGAPESAASVPVTAAAPEPETAETPEAPEVSEASGGRQTTSQS